MSYLISSRDPNTTDSGVSQAVFMTLIRRLARAWCMQDTEVMLTCFAPSIIYHEADIECVIDQAKLRTFFDTLPDTTSITFQQAWFDPVNQTGAGEYVFSLNPTWSNRGVAVIQLQQGRIYQWREYQRRGVFAFNTFFTGT